MASEKKVHGILIKCQKCGKRILIECIEGIAPLTIMHPDNGFFTTCWECTSFEDQELAIRKYNLEL
ncbi:MAG: hypothetical protein ABH956_00385 [Candidatus Nealsonbacteria bacterium]